MTYLCDVTNTSDLKRLFLVVITLQVSQSKLKYFRLNTKRWVIEVGDFKEDQESLVLIP